MYFLKQLLYIAIYWSLLSEGRDIWSIKVVLIVSINTTVC